jgi:hypothetical protein
MQFGFELLFRPNTEELLVMSKIVIAVLACMALITASASAQQKHSGVGTWKMDMSKSDLGSDPKPKSVTIMVFKDSPELVSWRVREVDDKGKSSSFSWKGPADGSMHPVMQNGKEIGKQSAKKDDQGALLRHGEDPDGSYFDARSMLSDDDNSMTDEVTAKSKDGKESKQKYVYHRVGNASKGGEKKPSA